MPHCRTCHHSRIYHDNPDDGGGCLLFGCACLEFRPAKPAVAAEVKQALERYDAGAPFAAVPVDVLAKAARAWLREQGGD